MFELQWTNDEFTNTDSDSWGFIRHKPKQPIPSAMVEGGVSDVKPGVATYQQSGG